MSDQEIYERLIEWMRQTWYGLPDAAELMPLMKAAYTPEEASLLNGMPFNAVSLDELAEMKQMDHVELRQKLDELAKKGLVFRFARGDSVGYRLNDPFFALYRASYWRGDTDERSKAMAAQANKYAYNGFFEQYANTQAKGLRALPIHEVIEDKRQIMPYDEVAKILDSLEYFAVSICPCRHRHNIDPDYPDSTYPMEVCLHFDRLGRYTVENGMGREITREETDEILRKSAEAGLVHGVSPWEEGVDTICNCDPEACIWFETFHKLRHGMSMTPSSYQVLTDPDSCIGCGLCVKRCHMQALHLADMPEARGRITRVTSKNGGGEKELKNKSGKVAVLEPELCIGCGVCAYKCSTQSLVLKRRVVIEPPPKTVHEYNRIVTTDFAAARSGEGQGTK